MERLYCNKICPVEQSVFCFCNICFDSGECLTVRVVTENKSVAVQYFFEMRERINSLLNDREITAFA